jgi:aspartyl/glutamyl-tRNA(Asn/Gln) amidotransferase C subunit
VEYTAQLANLQYTADELEALVPAFQEMLRFVDTLQSLEGAEPPGSETEAWTPTGERTLEELRPDTVDAFEETAAIRAQFPRIDRGLLLVPRVIGSDED